ncbi:MAG: hypothetical protein HY077_13625 [Elusimicrobia bacterium]|nr:hypothetical protein [Elusimicrobiota bacterium]
MTAHPGTRDFLLPPLIILGLAAAFGLFKIDDSVINYPNLGSFDGRTRMDFLADLNLPRETGVVLVKRIAGQLVPSERAMFSYGSVDGESLTHQLICLVMGIRITEHTIAFFINAAFTILCAIFSLLAGYLILRNGWLAIPIFALLAAFKLLSPGLIYGMPDMHAYMILNPPLVCSVFILVMHFVRTGRKHSLLSLIPAGFLLAYTGHIRMSEALIALASLFIFAVFLVWLGPRRKKIGGALLAAASLLALGWASYFGAVAGLRAQRDRKIVFAPAPSQERVYAPLFHALYISMVRFDKPNRHDDGVGSNDFYTAYPEAKAKFAEQPYFPGTKNLFRLFYSKEYAAGIRNLYFRSIIGRPWHFAGFLLRSAWDYFLFLPYYSWSGRLSSQGYIPNLNPSIPVDADDMSASVRHVHTDWILNLRWKYFPSSPLFYIYLLCAYFLVGQALYAASAAGSSDDAAPLPILCLLAMFIYFAFCSIVRILVPVHGQNSAVAFNAIAVFNLIRLCESTASKTVRARAPRFAAAAVLLLLGAAKVIAWEQRRQAVEKARRAEREAAQIVLEDKIAEKVERIIRLIKDNKAGGKRRTEKVFTVTESEANDYLQHWIRAKHGAGGVDVLSAAVHFEMERIVSAEAVVRLGPSPLQSLGSLRRYLNMDNAAELRLRVTSAKGKLLADVRKAKLKNITLPESLVQEVLKVVGEHQRPPVDFRRPFDLPNGIETVEVAPGAVRLTVAISRPE